MTKDDVRAAKRALDILDFVAEVDREPNHYAEGRLALQARTTGSPTFTLRREEAEVVYAALRNTANATLARLEVEI